MPLGKGSGAMINNKLNVTFEKVYSLSPLQEGILYHCIIDRDARDYVVQYVYDFAGLLHEELIEPALCLLARKHNILRASIVSENISEPKCIILKHKRIEYHTIDLRHQSRQQQTREIKSISDAERSRGFDLQKDSLLRIKNIALNDNDHIFVWSFHHIIMDGWCSDLVFNDFLEFYRELKEGKDSGDISQEIDDQRYTCADYSEYINWLNNKDKNSGIAYWKDLLQGYNGSAEITPLTSHWETGSQTKIRNRKFPDQLSEKTISLAKKMHVTLNTVFEAAWGVILQRYNNTSDVVYGKVVSGRNAPIKGIDQIVGLFINTIPVRVRTDDDTTIALLFDATQNQALDSLENDFCSLSEIQAATNHNAQLTKTLLTFQNYSVDGTKETADYGFEVKLIDYSEQTSYPISVTVFVCDGIIHLDMEYNVHSYTEYEIDKLGDCLANVVEQFSIDPDKKVNEIEIIPEEEREKIFGEFNDTYVEYPREKTVTDLFEEQVRKTPESIAVVFEEEQISYGELNEKANQLARRLRDIGVKPNDFVCLLTERSIEMIIGIYGIMKAGGAYVPIDPEFPVERINFIIADCRPKAVLVYKAHMESTLPVINLGDEAAFTGMTDDLQRLHTQADLAYCIYTSGTTGNPKGVLIEHKGLHNLLIGYTAIYGLKRTDTVLQVANYVFDQSVWDIFNILVVGGKLCLISRDNIRMPSEIERCCIKNHVTIASFTPMLINELEPKGFPTLRILDSSGETAKAEVLQGWVKNRTVINTYGPTEMTVNSSSYVYLGERTRNMPIGRPIANTKYYIVQGERMLLCGVGMPGELCIAGDGLARGYLNRPDTTAEKFVKNPFGQGMMYRSGDLARWLPDGNVEYLGRLDDQVKIRGYRIELGEVENAIKNMRGIKECVVIVKEDSAGDTALYAYIMADHRIDISALREKLMSRLPAYMIPAQMAQIEKVPLTKSGKIDRKSLPDIRCDRDREYASPRTKEEEIICEVFHLVLGNEQVGRNDSFFELGGDSIKSIRIVSKVREKGYELTVRDVMKNVTVKAIALAMKEGWRSHYEQGEITGWVPPTPILKEFIHSNHSQPQHYNQSMLLKLDGVDAECLKSVLSEIARHHDMLRAVYIDNRLKIVPSDNSNLYDYHEMEVTGENDVDEIELRCMRIQKSMDLARGPLLKAMKISTRQSVYLFICIHHLVVDGISWRILAEDIRTGIEQYKAKQKIVFPPKTASFKQWSEALLGYYESVKCKKDQQYWDSIIDELPIGRIWIQETGQGEDGNGIIVCNFDKEVTDALLHDSGKAYHTEINDLLLTAIGDAVKSLTGQTAVSVMLEGHGREEIHVKMDIDRTVGWFTSKYPVIVKVSDHIEENIIRTKEMLRKVPGNGLSYGLKWNDFDERVSILFNYMGEMDAEHREERAEELRVGEDISEANCLVEPIEFNGEVVNGCLSFHITYDRKLYPTEMINKLAECFKRSLKTIVDYCIHHDREVKTVSDVTAEQIDSEDLDLINTLFN